MKVERALGIIDAQRGFMPSAEGQRLGLDGFGELPVNDGEQIVEPINLLLDAFRRRQAAVFTTQDWHPQNTAHFSIQPDYLNNWPLHCVTGTPGAELHPDIMLPASRTRFIKGFAPLRRGDIDDSYSGFNATEQSTGIFLPEWLRQKHIAEVTLGGLALDYCVGKTALDIRQKLGLEVIVALDATRGINDDAVGETLEAFRAAGIRTATTDQILEQLPAVG